MDNVIGPTSAVAMRRDAIEAACGFDPRLPLMYDLDLYLRVLRSRPSSAMAIPEVLAYYRRPRAQRSRDWRRLQDWETVIQKWKRLAPEDVERFGAPARINMNRYFAYLAYERRSFGSGCAEAFHMHPAGFVSDWRNWKLMTACALPAPIHRRLERLAGIQTLPGETETAMD